MYRYLQYKVADFIDEIFSVPSTTILPQIGEKSQIAHEFDDGSVAVVGVSSRNYFTIELQWAYISPENHTIIMDFWHSESKGAGRRRTFYWTHPIDGITYTVRFTGPMTSSYFSIGHLQMSSMTLRVEGQKYMMVNLPLYDSLDFIAGSGVVTFNRAGAATYIDRYGVVQDLASGEPGFDADGLDLPPASTNLLTYSQDFSNAAWVQTGTGTATGGQTAPDGTSTAYLLDDTDTAADSAQWAQGVSVADDGVTRTGSIFLKEGTALKTTVSMFYTGGTLVQIHAVVTWATETTDFGNLERLGNTGWFRLDVPLTNNSSGNTICLFRVYPGSSAPATTGSVYAWGAQLEYLPFATPYIPTTSAPVARLGATATFPFAENCPGGIYAKTICIDLNIIGTKTTYALGLDFGGMRVSFSASSINDSKVCIQSNTGEFTTPQVSLSGRVWMGITFDSATSIMNLYANGVLVAQNLSATTAFTDTATVTLGGTPTYLKIKNLRIYDKALTEAQMRIA